MSVSAITTSNPLQEIANSLLQTYDKNADGKLGSDEFSSLISGLAKQLNVDSSAASSVSSAYIGSTATQPLQAFGGSGRFEGFDLSRAQDPQKSAKDAFAMLAGQSGSMPRTKAEAESWFNTSIKSQFEALGHKVNWVRGDKFSFTNWQGTFTVDFLCRADGDDPAFAWQCE